MPFIERPVGFSSETLELLDHAIMRMYQDHLADLKLKLSEAIAKDAAGTNLESVIEPRRP